ncbi:MAG: recombination mediator RecR [Bacteroidales bacterium]
MEYPSVLLENAVNEFSKLPGIGKKTALRLVLHLLRQKEEVGVGLGSSIIELRRNINYCRVCHNISDVDVCGLCSNPTRDNSVVCVVENVKELIAVENTMQFRGLYHVLGGIISPMEGIGPADLEIDSLCERVAQGGIKEVILALSTTMEGDTTNFYIFRKLAAYDIKISIIARGVSIGDELEYTDEVTLGRSILNRTLFNEAFKL